MENYFMKNLPDFTNINAFPKNEAFFNTALAATKELVDINAKYAGEILEKSVGFANLYVEGSEKQYQVVADVKDVNELTSRQSALVEEYSAKLAEIAEDNMKLTQGVSEQYQTWFKKNFEAAEVVAREAAEEVQKAAAKPVAKQAAKKTA